MLTSGVALPSVYGADSPKMNSADLRTKGYELSLSWRDEFQLLRRPFTYSVTVTFNDYVTDITKYDNPDRTFAKSYYEGMRWGEIWGYRIGGLFATDAEAAGYDVDQTAVNNRINAAAGSERGLHAGDLKFLDLDGDNVISIGKNTVDDPGDRKIIGNSEPRYIYTISLNADWNGFFLSALFDGVGRQQWFPSDESLFWGMYNRPYNQVPTWHLQNYWTEERPNAYLPRYVGYYGPMNAGTANINTRYLQDVSYIRLKNLQFGYDLPKRWISKIGLSKVSVYFSGENLWSWSPLYRHTKDFDVMVANKKSDSDISDSKGDGHNYPVMRSFSFGISITY